MESIKVIELFSGIGATRVAVDRVAEKLGKKVEHVAICEIDKYAIQSYNAIFGQTPNLGDITKVQHFPKCDLLSWTFPCTDLSKAGDCKGMEEGSGTRSALGWEVIRILKNTPMDDLPKWLLMENVPAVHNKKNLPAFQRMIDALASIGYTSRWADMNAKDHGVAQNRNRCIMISTLGREVPEFAMPNTKAPRKILKDYLEFTVPRNEEEAKYLLSVEELDRLLWKNDKNEKLGRGFDFVPRTDESTAVSITTRSGQRETDNYIMIPVAPVKDSCHEIANLNNPHQIESANRVYGVDGLSPTLTTFCGGGQVKVVAYPVAKADGKGDGVHTLRVVNGDTQGWAEVHDGDGIILGFYTGKETARGRVQDQMCATLQTSINVAVAIFHDYYWVIRTLTPKECWRLFGRTDEEFDKAKATVVKVCKNGKTKTMSDSQLYHQAGNSIVVEVLEDALSKVWGAGE